MPGWVASGVDEYLRRLPAGWRLRIVEHAQARGDTAALRTAADAAALLGSIEPRDHVVALDERGKQHHTAGFAQRLEAWQALGKPLVFVIGGADGLDESVRARADERLALSALTFPHPLVRVILIEQLYRAWSFNANHPYHRA